MAKEIVCTAEFIAKPNMLEKLIEELSKLIPLTKQEPGCLRYEMYRDLENPNKDFSQTEVSDLEKRQMNDIPVIKIKVTNVLP
jgi:hypothetical protein